MKGTNRKHSIFHSISSNPWFNKSICWSSDYCRGAWALWMCGHWMKYGDCSSVCQIQLLLKAQPLSPGFSVFISSWSPFLCLKIKNWLHSQLELAWFFSQMLGLAPFPIGHWKVQVICILIPCLARHHKSATLIIEVEKKKDLFSYAYVYHGVTKFSCPSH